MSDIVKFGKPIKVPTLSADPAGTESGVLYYNSTTGSLRAFEGGQWKDTSPISQELSLVKSPSTAIGWSETGSVFAAPVTTITAGDLPLAGVIDSAIQLVATGNAAEATDYSSYSITMPEGLKNTKLKIEWYQRIGSGFVGGEWTVSLYSGSTRTPLSTDSSGATIVPALNGKFTTTFDSDGSSSYTLRFARTSGSGSATLNIANVIVGPGIQPQGLAGGVISASSSFNNATGLTISNDMSFRRFGDKLAIFGSISTSGTGTDVGTFSVTLAGLTLEDSIPVYLRKQGSPDTLIPARALSSGGNLAFRPGDGGADASNNLGGTSFGNVTSGDYESIIFTGALIGIAEWAGSGTVDISQNDVEYAYNSDTSDAADTTSFGYGPQGIPVGAFSVQRTKRVRFQTPIQPTDKIEFEYNSSNQPGTAWQSEQIAGYGYTVQNTTDYGISLAPVSASTTDVNVTFHDYARPTGATFGAAGTAWSSLTGSRWRLKKTRGGQAVGFGRATSSQSGLVSREQEYEALGISVTGGGTGGVANLYCYRIGKQVTITIRFITGTGSPGSTLSVPAGSVPVDFRPPARIWNYGLFSTADDTFSSSSFETDGEIQAFNREIVDGADSIQNASFNASTSYIYTITFVKYL